MDLMDTAKRFALIAVMMLGAIAFGLFALSTAEAESNPPTPRDVEAPTPTPETHTVTRFGYKIALSTMGSRFAPRSVLLSIDAQAA